jgi:predicted amidohydrolase
MTRVAAVQLTSVPGDIDANAAEHARLIGEAKADVVVFPELSLTGYELDAIDRDPSLTLTQDDPRWGGLVRACWEAGATAIVGAPVAAGDGRRLAAVVLDRNGVKEVYAKRHVHDTEVHVFTPGDRDVVIEVGGTKLALGICFDSAHPEHAQAGRDAGADAYLVGAMFVDGEEEELAARMAERARTLGIWVVLAQHAGPTGAGTACGGSGIWAPDGEPKARLGREAPATLAWDIG